MINAVMLGAIAGCGRLPIPAEAFEAAIRADGKAVESNLRGFRAGLEAARQARRRATPTPAKRQRDAPPIARRPRSARSPRMPAAARDMIAEGVRRLAAYQDAAYARLYLDRLAPIREADERASAGGRLLRETARHLAVRMSYEDVIRVAQAKIDPGALRAHRGRDRRQAGRAVHASPNSSSPASRKCARSCRPGWRTRILAFAERRGWLDRVHWGMEVNTASVSGFLRFWLLAKLRRWRPRSLSLRARSSARSKRWLGLIAEAAQLSADLALEVAECARLIKGYGDTHKRGAANYRLIEAQVIRPALAGQIPLAAGRRRGRQRAHRGAGRSGRRGLARCLDRLGQQNALGIAAE